MANYNAIKYDGLSNGSLTLLSTTTASSDSAVSITSGIDSTYKEYLFILNNIHPSADSAEFGFQGDTGTNTSYAQTITSSFFHAAHRQDAAVTELLYDTGGDQANGTAFQLLAYNIDNGNCKNNFKLNKTINI